MSDDLGGVEVSTNGSGAIDGADISGRSDAAVEALDGQSIDERLAALRETIRTWDWRAAAGDSDTSPSNNVRARAVSTATNPLEGEAPPAAVRDDLTGVQKDRVVPIEVVSIEIRESDVASPKPVAVDLPNESTTDDPPAQQVTKAVPIVTEGTGDVSMDAGGMPSEPQAVDDDLDSLAAVDSGPHEETGPLSRVWSRSSTRTMLGCIIAAALVFVVIWLLRPAGSHKSPTVTQPTSAQASASLSTTTTTAAAPLAAAQLTQYEQYATALEKANGTAATGLGGLGNPPTLTQVTPVITPYLQAVKVYNLQFHAVQWPASMQVDVAADEAQLTAFINYLQTVGTGNPTNMDTWLSQLETQGAATQASDNKIRKDLGLPASSSYP